MRSCSLQPFTSLSISLLHYEDPLMISETLVEPGIFFNIGNFPRSMVQYHQPFFGVARFVKNRPSKPEARNAVDSTHSVGRHASQVARVMSPDFEKLPRFAKGSAVAVKLWTLRTIESKCPDSRTVRAFPQHLSAYEAYCSKYILGIAIRAIEVHPFHCQRGDCCLMVLWIELQLPLIDIRKSNLCRHWSIP